MSRLKKLLTVSIILLVGVGLAWPFRKTGMQTPTTVPQEVRQQGRLVADQPSFPDQPPALNSGRDSSARHVVAKMASTTERSPAAVGSPKVPRGASFDLANHPSVIARPQEATLSPVTPTTPLDGVSDGHLEHFTPDRRMAIDGDDGMPVEVLHIVRNSDTLEKLAKRYLGDGGRALEIFDLNRDKLENPHLLPIGAELRIPVAGARMVD